MNWIIDLCLQCEVCDEGCAKRRPAGCPHSCPLPCHPGDCPPCSQMIRQRCHCKISMLYVECTSVQTHTEGFVEFNQLTQRLAAAVSTATSEQSRDVVRLTLLTLLYVIVLEALHHEKDTEQHIITGENILTLVPVGPAARVLQILYVLTDMNIDADLSTMS